MDAKNERKVLAFPINSARTGELEATMEVALVTRTAMISGRESACSSLGDSVDPTVKSLQYRIETLLPGEDTRMPVLRR